MIARPMLGIMGVAVTLAMTANASWGQEEFDEANVYVEINATDGDAGLHGILDADAWDQISVKDTDDGVMIDVTALQSAAVQGLTELFFESAEPVCRPEDAEEDEEAVPLSEFLARFPAGTYLATGMTLEGDPLESEMELTHDLPAAPIITHFNGHVVSWSPGFDLGNCNDPEAELPTDPAMVPATAYEVTVEPADDEAFDPLRVLTVQLGPDARHLVIPPQFVNSYPVGTAFKVEVGAIEASGNRTFSELSLEEE